MNSVGDEMVQLASPPAAPASQTLYNGVPLVVGSVVVVVVVVVVSRYFKLRLYVTKSKALRAPYPRMGAAAPIHIKQNINVPENQYKHCQVTVKYIYP